MSEKERLRKTKEAEAVLRRNRSREMRSMQFGAAGGLAKDIWRAIIDAPSRLKQVYGQTPARGHLGGGIIGDIGQTAAEGARGLRDLQIAMKRAGGG